MGFSNANMLSFVQGTSVLSPVIPFVLVLVPAIIIFLKSEQHIYQNHPALYILAFGLVAAKVTNKLVVSLSNIVLLKFLLINYLSTLGRPHD